MTRNFASGRGSFQTNRSTNPFSTSVSRTTSSSNGNLNFRGQTTTLGDIGNTRDNQQVPTDLPRKCNRSKSDTGNYQYETFLKNWKNLTSSNFVLNVVSGIRLQFTSSPNQLHIPKAIEFCEN